MSYNFIIKLTRFNVFLVTFTIFSLTFSTNTSAQLFDQELNWIADDAKLDQITTKDVVEKLPGFNFRAQGQAYLINNEYNNTIAEGATLFGLQQFLRGFYKVSPNFRISAGFAVDFQFGDQKLNLFPLINFQYQKNKTFLRVGDLSLQSNNQNPYLLESFDFRFLNPVQYGLETKTKWSNFSLHTYFVIAQIVIRNTNIQEELYGGFTAENKILKTNKNYLSLKYQFQAHHFGGEGTKDKLNISSYFHHVPSIIFNHYYINRKVDHLTAQIAFNANHNILDEFPDDPGGWGLWGSLEFFISNFSFATGGFYMSGMTILNGDDLMSGFTQKLRGGRNQFKRALWFNRVQYIFTKQKDWSFGSQFYWALEVNNDFALDHSLRFWLKYDIAR